MNATILHIFKGFFVATTSFVVATSTAYANGPVGTAEWWASGASACTALAAYLGVAVAAPAVNASRIQAKAASVPVDPAAVEGMPVE